MSRILGIRCWLLAVFIGLCSPGILFAQTVSFIHLGVENGLVQSQVQTVCQDPNGHLWIGTLAGLTRYSGHHSQHYLRNDSLAEEWITACHVNPNTGDMWLGHWGGGLTYYNAVDQQFRSLNFEPVGDFRTITDIQEDEQGDAWIATEGSGVFRYLTEENRFESLAADPRMLSLNVTAISMDVNERLWLGTDAGVTVLNPKAGERSTDRFVRLTVEDGLPSNTVTDIIRLSNRNMMVATTNGAVIISYASNKINREGFIHFNTSNGLSSNRITNLLEDRQGNIWLGTENAGVNRYSVVTRSVTNYNVRNGLNYNSINDLFQDREATSGSPPTLASTCSAERSFSCTTAGIRCPTTLCGR
ncbi:MAG: two-component regulator propeller domain-containing protein [Bacteroidota bacterium]